MNDTPQHPAPQLFPAADGCDVKLAIRRRGDFLELVVARVVDGVDEQRMSLLLTAEGAAEFAKHLDRHAQELAAMQATTSLELPQAIRRG